MNFSITNYEGAFKPSTPPRPTYDPDPVDKEQVLRQHRDCLEGVGCFRGECHITADPTILSSCAPTRKSSRGPQGALEEGTCVCMCILNWPLPIGAFQDQCKQTMINKYLLIKKYY